MSDDIAAVVDSGGGEAPATSEPAQSAFPAESEKTVKRSAFGIETEEDAPKSKPAQKQAQAASEELFEVKVNGKTEKWTKEKLIREAQIGAAGRTAMQEKARIAKEHESVKSAIDSGDHKALAKLMGNDRLKKLAIDYINEQIELEEMDPRERALRDREAKLRESEELSKKAEEARKQQELQKLEEHYAQKFDEEITEALKQTKLPQHPYTVRRMAELMLQNLEMNLDLPATSVAKLVEEEVRGSVKGLVGALDGDDLVGLLGDEVAGRVRRHSLKSIKNPTPQARAPGQVFAKGVTEKKPMTRDEWKEHLEKIRAQGD